VQQVLGNAETVRLPWQGPLTPHPAAAPQLLRADELMTDNDTLMYHAEASKPPTPWSQTSAVRRQTECEDSLEKEQLVRLPSTGRFEDRFSHCQAAFDLVCIGPAHTGQVRHQA